MEKAAEYIWRVPSDSDADKNYIVDVTPGSTETCTCVAFAIKRNKTGRGWCKHLDYVIDKADEEARAEFERIKEQRLEDTIRQSLLKTVRDLS